MAPDPRRLELQELLEDLLGSPNVYFQPPETVQMSYPCIVYRRNSSDTKFANNDPYSRTKQYEVVVIDRDPDSAIPDKVAALPLTLFDRFFTVDNLNHDVFNVFF